MIARPVVRGSARCLVRLVRCVLRLGLFLAPALAHAQSASPLVWPQRPVILVVSSAPGAGVDFFARMLADQLPAPVHNFWHPSYILRNGGTSSKEFIETYLRIVKLFKEEL